jgi:chemotaxis protein CheD
MAHAAHAETAPRRFLNPRDGLWHTQITQGEYHVSAEENEVLTTVLGSCVSACIRDPVRRVGGMNHFLLPEGDALAGGAMRYGVHAMERLINALLGRGAVRERLEAKLFGGANVMASLSGVGWRNAEFAERFLEQEGIRIVGGDLRGSAPRRIQFWPATGRARQLAIAADAQRLMQQEITQARAGYQASEEDSDLELF